VSPGVEGRQSSAGGIGSFRNRVSHTDVSKLCTAISRWQKVILVYGLIIHHNTVAALSQCLYTVVHEDVQCSHSVSQGWMMKMCSDRQTDSQT